ncbi:MAG: sialidase family protein [Candidatus Latescibacterota bacterium]
MSDSAQKSQSPRVSWEILHPDSMDAARPYGVVIDGKPGPRWFNYQVQLCVTPKGTWIACWTQGSYESQPNQRVVCARSTDNGKTWSEERAIEEAGGKYQIPAWIMSFVVPHTGRIYMFYWYNINGVPLRDAGDLFFRCSDDDGMTWSQRHRVGIPRSSMDDPSGDLHGWNFGQPQLLPTGQVIMTYNKIKRSSLFPVGWRLDEDHCWQPEGGTDPSTLPKNEQGGSPNNWCTEVFLLELTHILTADDPASLHFRFLPEGDEGLHVPYPGTDRHFGQEGTLVGLSGGRLLCVFRSRQGHPFYAISSDCGASWSHPEMLRLSPGGDPFNQPYAPCPISRRPDGRLVFLFHNARPDTGGWYPRDPLWIAVGREVPGVEENAGLTFSKPQVVVYNDGKPDGPFGNIEISYPAFYRIAGKHYIAYANKTCQLLIHEVPDSLLEG